MVTSRGLGARAALETASSPRLAADSKSPWWSLATQRLDVMIADRRSSPILLLSCSALPYASQAASNSQSPALEVPYPVYMSERLTGSVRSLTSASARSSSLAAAASSSKKKSQYALVYKRIGSGSEPHL